LTIAAIPAHPDRCYILAIQVAIEIPDELAAQAQARGLALEAYSLELIASETAKPKLIPLGLAEQSCRDRLARSAANQLQREQ
jgi:hypothetical protein